MITGIYNLRYKESAIFQIFLTLKCRKFIPFILYFSFIPCTSQKTRAKSRNVFCIHIILRKPGSGFYFQIIFSFFQSLIQLPVARVRHFEISFVYIIILLWKKNALAELRFKIIQIEAFYFFFRSFIRSSLYPLLALQLVLFKLILK